MIKIENAILHIFDAGSSLKILSDLTLEVEEAGIKSFLSKCVKKHKESPDLKTAVLKEESDFSKKVGEYAQKSMEFVPFTKWVAETVFDGISLSDNIRSADVVVCECVIGEQPKLFILKYENKTGYVHNVQNFPEGVRNSLLRHVAILPNPSQKASECAIVDLETHEVSFFDKTYSINGKEENLFQDVLIHCESKLSPKDTLKQVNEVVSNLAEAYGENVVAAVAKVKAVVNDVALIGGEVQVEELGQEIFAESEELQEAYKKEVTALEIPEKVSMLNTPLSKANKIHKIKTDTGIELTIPIDYYNNKEYMEFINNPDGTISIALKNINQIINK